MSGRLAGRCLCGLALELVAKDPEPHLACRGLRRCRACREAKPESEFWRYRQRGGLIFTRCRSCGAAAKTRRYHADPIFRDRVLASSHRHYWRTKLHQLDRGARYHAAHRDRILAQKRAYYLENKEAMKAKARAHYVANRARILTKKAIYDQTRRTTRQQGRAA